MNTNYYADRTVKALKALSYATMALAEATAKSEAHYGNQPVDTEEAAELEDNINWIVSLTSQTNEAVESILEDLDVQASAGKLPPLPEVIEHTQSAC